MTLRPFIMEKDFVYLQKWITDQRTHALWCANIIPYPLRKETLAIVLENDARDWGGKAYTMLDEYERPIGFFVFSVNKNDNTGFLRFVVLDNTLRGQGVGVQMLQQISEFAFELTGVSAVQLNVFDVNLPARKCYEKVGFVEDAMTPNVFVFQNEQWGRCHMIKCLRLSN